MDCAEIRAGFARGAAPTGPDVVDHAAACAACRALLDGGALGTLLAEQRASDELDDGVLLARVQARLAREVGVRGWLRSQSTPRRFALAAVVLAFSTAPALESASPRPISAFLAVSLALLGTGLLVALVSVLRPLSRPVRPPRVLAVAAGSLALPFVLAAVAAADRPAEHMALPLASACFLYGAALSLPVFVLLRLLDRAEHVSLSSLAVLAGTCGLVANFILRLHCPSEEPLHLLLGHATIGLTWLFLSFAPNAFRGS